MKQSALAISLVLFFGVAYLFLTSEALGRKARSVKAAQATLEAMYSTTPPVSPCRWLRQHRMCTREPGIPALINEARKLTSYNCEETFKYERWNCSMAIGNTYFFAKDKVYRETALMQSLAAAALTHTVARACAESRLKQCACAEQQNNEVSEEELKRIWRWGGCGDNIKHGRRFVRNILQLKQVGDDPLALILKRNVEIGMKVVNQQVGELCTCHGVSGSCVTKTCWRRLQPFNQITSLLKEKYHRALRRDPTNWSSRRFTPKQRSKGGTSTRLVYMERPSSFCASTRGRRCLEPDNCSTLCCGRGFSTKVVPSRRRCKCQWRRCCSVECNWCWVNQEIYTCK